MKTFIFLSLFLLGLTQVDNSSETSLSNQSKISIGSDEVMCDTVHLKTGKTKIVRDLDIRGPMFGMINCKTESRMTYKASEIDYIVYAKGGIWPKDRLMEYLKTKPCDVIHLKDGSSRTVHIVEEGLTMLEYKSCENPTESINERLKLKDIAKIRYGSGTIREIN